MNYSWHTLPAVGTSGGILIGINEGSFELIGVICRKYCMTVTLKKYMMVSVALACSLWHNLCCGSN